MHISLVYGKNCSGKTRFLNSAKIDAQIEVAHYTARNVVESGDVFRLIDKAGRLVSRERGMLLIEHPESLLHPSRHTEILSAIIECRPKFALIETHSELIALRAKKLVKEGVLNSNQLEFVVCQRDEHALPYTIVRVNPDGRFDRPWPNGFFPERRFED